MLVPGTILGDRYEIIELIGAGGMANVYKAVDRKLNREVAIKVLKDEYSSNKNFVSKFKAEAQAAAGLMHPNIVNVYDVGDENGLYYFVMELVDGITLKNYIEKKIRLSVKEAVSIAIQVSMGIEAAHNKGIIHRDIKPQNIIISRDGKVKVADFGIARAATSDTITTHAMGSVHYTSPEQARGGYSDAKSDIYSIGISLFEMVTGRVPFDGETTVSIAIKHIQEEMPSPRMYVPEIPISVEQIIFKCTQKNPDRRYLNISELVADLKRSLINPDENFVVIQDAASNAGTRTITEQDRQEIRRSVQNEPPQGESYRDQMFQNQGYGVPGQQQPSQAPQPPIQQQPIPPGQQPGQPPRQQMFYGYPPQAPQPGQMQQQPYPPQPGQGQQPYPPQPGQMQQPYPPQSGQMQQPYPPQPGQVQQPYPPAQAGPEILPLPEDDDADDDMIDFLFTPKLTRQQAMEAPRKEPEEEPEEKPGRERVSKREKKKREKEQRRLEEESESPRKSRRQSRDDRYMSEERDSEVDPKMERVMSVLLIIAAVIVALVAIFVVGRALGLFKITPSSQLEEGMVETPDVVGLSLDEASAVLREAGLKATASYQESAVYDKDIIAEQSPAAGEAIEEGGSLNLIISSGKVEAPAEENGTQEGDEVRTVSVPNVVGLLKAEARVMLENEDFTVVEEEVDDAEAEMSSVVRQMPDALSDAPYGSTVTLYICTGRPVGEVTVPDLTGKEQAEAERMLEELKLTHANVTEVENEAVAKGLVVSQSVAPGTNVDEGSNVDLTISKGPQTFSCNITIPAPADYLAGSPAQIFVISVTGAAIGDATAAALPFNYAQSGIIGNNAGQYTVTYMNLYGEYVTTDPVVVNFTPE
ncbi:MAG: Stk1 family PASTA domain-containing Ser/Thr kinase [Lachnospiraceae bacterium]|nr:Stk1 family PASTA domain-containing Ser/Thr kinase [Lachnospiraceae bacterium]